MAPGLLWFSQEELAEIEEALIAVDEDEKAWGGTLSQDRYEAMIRALDKVRRALRV